MSLTTTLSRATRSAFAAVGDVQKTITYQRRSAGSYDTTTGTVGGGGSSVTVSALLATYSLSQLSAGVIEAGDRRVVIEAAALSFAPTTSDAVMIDGSTYQVITVSLDAAGLVYTLQVRR